MHILSIGVNLIIGSIGVQLYSLSAFLSVLRFATHGLSETVAELRTVCTLLPSRPSLRLHAFYGPMQDVAIFFGRHVSQSRVPSV